MSQNSTHSENKITPGDCAMATLMVIFLVFPILGGAFILSSLALSIYNFLRSRPKKGLFYLGVLGLQLFLIIIIAIVIQ